MQYNMLLLFVKDKLQVVCLAWVDGGERAGTLGDRRKPQDPPLREPNLQGWGTRSEKGKVKTSSLVGKGCATQNRRGGHPGKKQGQELYCGAKAAPPASDVGGLGGERSKNPDANGGTWGTRLRSERRQLPPARFERLRAAHCHRRLRPSRADSSPGNRDSFLGSILVIANCILSLPRQMH